MRLTDCHNFHDFRELARCRLPGPIFDYIDGAADDEVTNRRNAASFEGCDLIPNVLRGVKDVDLSVTVMGQRLTVPFYCSPTALQRQIGRASCRERVWNCDWSSDVCSSDLRCRLPGPIFDYIDGAADDEVTNRRNAASFEGCDLIPNVLRGVKDVDLSVTVMGQRLTVPFYCSPTALQR